MRDFWDSVAQLFGYDYWEWGSAADWVGAVGTVGAFLFGFMIFARDRLRQTRELADRFATWLEKDVSPDTNMLRAHNGSNLPVVDATILMRVGTDIRRRDIGHDPAAGHSIGAGVSASIALRGDDANASVVYVKFTDGTSREWTRELQTGRYLNRWQRWRLNKQLVAS